MKSTANRTRPKIIKAGIVGLTEGFWGGVALCARIMEVPPPLFKRSNHRPPHPGWEPSGKLSRKEARLLASRALLRLDGRNRGHVQDAARRYRRDEDMSRPRW